MTLSRHPLVIAAFLAVPFVAAPFLAAPGAALAQQATSQAAYTAEELYQLLAPVALYPDPLLANMLMAATYPVEVVEAARWRAEAGHSVLRGDFLAASLSSESWAPSVKALEPFPAVLQTMSDNLEWTRQVGAAMVAQQADVMAVIQNLRVGAINSGALDSGPQQTVSTADDIVTIEPANADALSIPVYNPATVYGPWPYPANPPVSFVLASAPAAAYAAPVTTTVYTAAVPVVPGLWGWQNWDWVHDRIAIDTNRYAALNQGAAPSIAGQWRHEDHISHAPGQTQNQVQVQTQVQVQASAPARAANAPLFNEPQQQSLFEQRVATPAAKAGSAPPTLFNGAVSTGNNEKNDKKGTQTP
jgi:hypothetical protein